MLCYLKRRYRFSHYSLHGRKVSPATFEIHYMLSIYGASGGTPGVRVFNES